MVEEKEFILLERKMCISECAIALFPGGSLPRAECFNVGWFSYRCNPHSKNGKSKGRHFSRRWKSISTPGIVRDWRLETGAPGGRSEHLLRSELWRLQQVCWEFLPAGHWLHMLGLTRKQESREWLFGRKIEFSYCFLSSFFLFSRVLI